MPKIPIAWYIIIVLTGYIIFLKSCEKKCPEAPKTFVIKRDTTVVTVTETVHDKPKPFIIQKPVYYPEHIDTAKIINDYLSRVAYRDTAKNKYGYVLIIDTLTENKIATRQVDFHLDLPLVTVTEMVKPRNQVYGGLELGGAKTYVSFGPMLLLKTKTDKLYWLGASYTSQNDFYFHAGSAWKIHF